MASRLEAQGFRREELAEASKGISQAKEVAGCFFLGPADAPGTRQVSCTGVFFVHLCTVCITLYVSTNYIESRASIP